MILLECPGCSATFAVPESQAGKTGKCSKCGVQFTIPAADAAAVPPTEPASPQPVNDSESVEVKPCPGCGARIAAARTDLGTTVECPYCVTHFLAEAANGLPRRPPTPDRDRPSSSTGTLRRSGRRDESDDERDERPRRSRRRVASGDDPPSAVGTMGILLLIGGILSLGWTLGAMVFTSALTCGLCCFWPGFYLTPIWGVLAIIRGSAMMGGSDSRGSPPAVLQILQTLMVLNLDVTNMVLGIVGLVMSNNEPVQDYYASNANRYDD